MPNVEHLPSICIPRVIRRTTKHNVEKVFQQLGWGQIKNITMNYKDNYNQVFIDFSKWNMDDPKIDKIRQKLIQGETIKVVYDEPWFWKCSMSRYNKLPVTDNDLLLRKRLNQRIAANKIENH